MPPELSPALARDILARLGEAGQPPEVGITWVNVGNRTLLQVLDTHYLAPMARDGRGSSFKLVQAYFGGGKTHFLYCVRDLAWRHGFASAIVGLSPDECPFDDPVRIYEAVARELSWAPADPLVPPARGIESALRTAMEERLATADPATVRTWLDEAVRRTPVDAPSYRSAVVGYCRAVVDGDGHTEELLASWLRGEQVGPAEVREHRVREALSRSTAFRFLRTLCQLLPALGAPGLVLAFDELDRNLSLPTRRRQAVADNLRQLIDLCGREALPGLLCLYAAPPEFMRHVVSEYPALQQRLESPSVLSERSPQAAIIDLERLDLDDAALLAAIGERLLEVFEVAWSPGLDRTLQRDNLGTLAREVQQSSFEVAHRRAYVKAAVELLHRQAREERPVSRTEARELAGRGGEVVDLRKAAEWEVF